MDYATAATDLDGKVYISGSTDSSLGGDNLGQADAFLAKYSAEGALRWIRQLGKPEDGYNSGGVATDRRGNSYIGGTIYRANGTSTLAFVAAYSGDGAFRWEREPRPSPPYDLDEGGGIATDGEDNVYVAEDTAPGDAFVSRYSTSGALRRTRRLGTPSSDDSASGVGTDRDGNVYISGSTGGGRSAEPMRDSRMPSSPSIPKPARCSGAGNSAHLRPIGRVPSRPTGMGVCPETPSVRSAELIRAWTMPLLPSKPSAADRSGEQRLFFDGKTMTAKIVKALG